MIAFLVLLLLLPALCAPAGAESGKPPLPGGGARKPTKTEDLDPDFGMLIFLSKGAAGSVMKIAMDPSPDLRTYPVTIELDGAPVDRGSYTYLTRRLTGELFEGQFDDARDAFVVTRRGGGQSWTCYSRRCSSWRLFQWNADGTSNAILIDLVKVDTDLSGHVVWETKVEGVVAGALAGNQSGSSITFDLRSGPYRRSYRGTMNREMSRMEGKGYDGAGRQVCTWYAEKLH